MEQYTHYIIDKSGIARPKNPYYRDVDEILWSNFERDYHTISYHAFDTDGNPMPEGEYSCDLFGAVITEVFSPTVGWVAKFHVKDFTSHIRESRVAIYLKSPVQKESDKCDKCGQSIEDANVEFNKGMEHEKEYLIQQGYKSPEQVEIIVKDILSLINTEIEQQEFMSRQYSTKKSTSHFVAEILKQLRDQVTTKHLNH